MDKDPSDPGADLCIIQFCGEGTVEVTWTQIHPNCHLPSSEWLNAVPDKGLHEVRARQPAS
jgi:hypothetical protein